MKKFAFVSLLFALFLFPSSVFAQELLVANQNASVYWESGEGFYKKGDEKISLGSDFDKEDVALLPSGNGAVYRDSIGSKLFVYDHPRKRTINIIPHYDPNPELERGFYGFVLNPGKDKLSVTESITQGNNFLIFDLERLEDFLASFKKTPGASGVITIDDELDGSGVYMDLSSFFPEEKGPLLFHQLEWFSDEQFGFRLSPDPLSAVEEKYQASAVGGQIKFTGYYTASPSFHDTTEVTLKEGGDLTYKTGEMESAKTIEADVPAKALVDVSSDGKWLAFLDGLNIFMLNLGTQEIHQISLNMDPHWSWFYLGLSFSPNGKYLLTEIQRDGVGGLDSCIYDLDRVDFENVKSQVDRYHEDHDLGRIQEQCSYVARSLYGLMEERKILPLADWRYFDVYDSAWAKDGFLEFSTSFPYGDQRWSISPETWEINQTKGIPLANPPFSDMRMDDPDMNEVLRAMEDGWLEGYPDGTLRLDSPVNRAELVKVGVQALAIPDSNARFPNCPDLPLGMWYTGAFMIAIQEEAIGGYPEEGISKENWPCKPGQTINKVEALKVILKLAGFHTGLLLPEDYANQFADTKDEAAWFAPYTAYAKIETLIRPLSDGRLLPAEPMTRREMIYLANHVIDALGKWKEEF